MELVAAIVKLLISIFLLIVASENSQTLMERNTIIKNTTDLFPSTASAGLCSFKQSMSVGHPFGSAASVPRLQLLIDPHLIGSILGGSIYDPVAVSD